MNQMFVLLTYIALESFQVWNNSY